MSYVNFPSGFNITSKDAVDSRIIKTKAEMKAMTTSQERFKMPPVYLCLCPDDHKIYIFDLNNPKTYTDPQTQQEVEYETGRFRPIDDYLTFSTPEAKAQLNEAIKNSVEIVTVKQQVQELQGSVETLAQGVTTVTERVTAVEGRLDTAEEDITNIEGDIYQIKEVDLTQIKADVKQAQDDIGTVEKPNTIKYDIDKIQKWIVNVKLDGGEVKPESSEG